MCGLTGYLTGNETPFEGNAVVWCWQPNGDGTYSPWSLAYNGKSTSWVKANVSLDVQCITGGFTNSGGYLYVTGWSPSIPSATPGGQPGGYVMKSINIAYSSFTDLFSSPLLAQLADGFEQSLVPQGVLAAELRPASGFAMGQVTAQVGSIVNPVATMAGFVVDVGAAPFAPNLVTESGAWLRAPINISGMVASNTVMSRYLAGQTVSLMGFDSIAAQLTPAVKEVFLQILALQG